VTPGVRELLPATHEDLLRFVRRNGGRLLRRESAEDLVQAIHARALEHGADCTFVAREPFLKWLYRVAASHLADRHSYWRALRRSPDRLLRLTHAGSDTDDPVAVPEPVTPATGPGTRAGREEEARLALRALTLLLPRDRSLVEGLVADVPVEEEARRLGVTYTAARQARHRAVARFRTAHAALARKERADRRP
jgi:DNA-directed RNA polymerase specialized sigma24 family protein